MTQKETKNRRNYYRYSICFKEKVLQELSSGLSIEEVRRRYGIKGTGTVQYWIKKFGRKELLNEIIYVKMKGEKDEIKRLQDEVKRLKIALGEAALARQALESLIDVVDEHYQTDVKKNFGQRLLVGVTGKKEQA
jgi:transposase-like protein